MEGKTTELSIILESNKSMCRFDGM